MFENVKKELKKIWGYDDFLPYQNQAIKSVLDSKDSVVVLPTGGGKSLCYQAPGISMPGTAVIISPLISLMKDQVDTLLEYGISAARIDSSMMHSDKERILIDLKNGKLKILYVSPERLMMNSFLEFMKKINISFFAVDESHCISMWGHDFRPEYRRLAELRELFPGVAIHAYTATATVRVKKDIIEQLKLKDPEIITGTFFRSNLIYKVEYRTDKINQIRKIIDKHKNESGIIYCIRRKDVEDLHQKLKALGYRTAPYHAGMEDADRKKNQDAFIKEKVEIIIATVAFGMGIDKSNVRYVIHSGMPKSIEHYQQESGRAGRDGLEAECVLLYGGEDFQIWNFIIDKQIKEGEISSEMQDAGIDKLSDMYNYCTGTKCRHKYILEYFDEKFDSENCAACDVCIGDLDPVDEPLVVSQKILSCVVRLKENFGAHYTSLVLMGSADAKIIQNGHNALSTYGILSEFTQSIIRTLIEQLIAQGFMRKFGEFNQLQITESGWELIRGEAEPKLYKPAMKPAARDMVKIEKMSWEGVDRGLFSELRELRKRVADEKKLPAYVVFTDAALRDMARKRPSTSYFFTKVSGVGQRKCEQYGALFVNLINRYCDRNSLDKDIFEHDVSTPRKSGISDSRELAFRMFDNKASIEEVMEKTDKVRSTVIGYLVLYIEDNDIIDPEPWVETDVLDDVAAAADEVGIERLKPVYDKLDEEVDYDTIRICIACLKNL